jgi:AcrR family transcriptional regulator
MAGDSDTNIADDDNADQDNADNEGRPNDSQGREMNAPQAAGASGGGSGRERILAAAITKFAEDGLAGTSLKTIADEAGVTQGLIVHHFGSKEGLRKACDDHVLGKIREQLRIAADQGTQLDVLEAFRRRQKQHAAALPYLARALADGAPSVAALVDELAEEIIRSMEQNVANGVYVPTEYPRERALVLLIWSLGAVTLHEHVRRLLGADLTGEPAALLPYLRGATEMLTDGLFTEALRDNVREAVVHLEQE